jgi:hypothetical protein
MWILDAKGCSWRRGGRRPPPLVSKDLWAAHTVEQHPQKEGSGGVRGGGSPPVLVSSILCKIDYIF